jgi:hypothetical protein
VSLELDETGSYGQVGYGGTYVVTVDIRNLALKCYRRA